MKLKLILLMVAALVAVILPSCNQLQPAPKAYGFTPKGPIYNGCRYTATWGGDVVHWIDNTNGYRWTCTYQEFFRYCGKNHPNSLGIAVRGKLPDSVLNPQQHTAALPAKPVAEASESSLYPVPQ